MKGRQFRDWRKQIGISGSVVSGITGIRRSRLSDIEREYVQPSGDEAAKLGQALQDLDRAKQELAATAERYGWPVAAL